VTTFWSQNKKENWNTSKCLLVSSVASHQFRKNRKSISLYQLSTGKSKLQRNCTMTWLSLQPWIPKWKKFRKNRIFLINHFFPQNQSHCFHCGKDVTTFCYSCSLETVGVSHTSVWQVFLPKTRIDSAKCKCFHWNLPWWSTYLAPLALLREKVGPSPLKILWPGQQSWTPRRVRGGQVSWPLR